MRVLILILLFCSIGLAQEKTVESKDTFILQKPQILSNTLLTKEQSIVVKNALLKQGRLLIHPKLEPAKNDYVDDYDRGTVQWTPNVRNYSFHKVIIPDGTIIKDSNFTQNQSNTDAIIGENLIFIDCNLTNILLHKSWKLTSSRNDQLKITIEEMQNEEVAARTVSNK